MARPQRTSLILNDAIARVMGVLDSSAGNLIYMCNADSIMTVTGKPAP
jgi:hypothetical protein